MDLGLCVLGGELGIKANVNYFFLKTLILCLTLKLPCYERALEREFGDARLCSMCDHTALMSQSVCNTGEPLPSILPCLASHPDLLVWGGLAPLGFSGQYLWSGAVTSLTTYPVDPSPQL